MNSVAFFILTFCMFIKNAFGQQCPIGTYLNGGSCVNCAVVCYTCDLNGCTDCLASNFRTLFGTQCIPIDGYYETDQAVARRCPELQCKVCHPQNTDRCQECFDGYYQNNNGIFGSPQDCFACDESCATCNGPNPNDCLGCHDGFYLNGNICESCSIQGCLQCSSISVCDACEPRYYVQQGLCKLCSESIIGCSECSSAAACDTCETDYPEDGNGGCQIICSNFMAGCLDCSSISVCDACELTYHDNGSGSCILCSESIIGCSECSSAAVCDRCESGYFLDDLQICSQCLTNCASCTNINICQSCISGYQAINGICLEHDECGDGIVTYLPCDLPLGVKYDGCTDNCEIEQNFQCIIQNSATFCSYSGQISATFLGYNKNMFENKIYAKYQLGPNLSAFSETDMSSYFSLNDSSLVIISSKYDPATAQLQLQISYNETIKNASFEITFDPTKTSEGSQKFFSTPVSSSNFELSEVHYYSDSQYEMAKFVYISSFIFLSLGLISCLGALPVRKLAGLELMFVYQYAWIVLLWFPNFMPFPIEAIKMLKYTSGYNEIFQIINVDISPPYINTFSLSNTYLWQNFNLNFITYILPILMALISKIINKVSQNSIVQTRSLKFFQFSLQLLMYSVMFNVLYLVTCSLIFFTEGDITDIYSYLTFAFPVLITAGVLIKFGFDPDPFNRFRYEFKMHKLAYVHYFFYFAYLVGCVLLLGLVSQPWAPLVLILSFAIYTVGFRPYNLIRQNLRSVFYILIMGLAVSINLYASYMDASNLLSQEFLAFHLIFIVLLIVALIWCYVEILYAFFEKFCRKNEIQKQDFKIFEDIYCLSDQNTPQNCHKNSLIAGLLFDKKNMFDFIKDQEQKLKSQRGVSTVGDNDQGLPNLDKISSPLNDYIQNQSSRTMKKDDQQIGIEMVEINKNQGNKQCQKIHKIAKLIVSEQNHLKLRQVIKMQRNYTDEIDERYVNQYNAI